VPRNAHNRTIGNVADRFDELRGELQGIQADLREYVIREEGAPKLLFKLSSPNTPAGHRLLGRFSALARISH
jgi:hypothetical protein